MKQSISAPLAIVVVALVVVVALGIGWYMMNRELKPVPYDANAAHAAVMPSETSNATEARVVNISLLANIPDKPTAMIPSMIGVPIPRNTCVGIERMIHGAKIK